MVHEMTTGVALDSIVEKQKKRYSLLLKIYELTDGDEAKPIMLETPGPEAELLSAIDYLSGEGLVESLADGVPFVRISHQGVVEVEKSITNPREPTEHFLPQVIQYFYATVGSVQTGEQSVAYVSQNIGNPEVLQLVEMLRSHLDNGSLESEREGNELVDGLQGEVKAVSPNQSRVKLYLKGLETFMKDSGKELLVEIASKVISNQIGLP
jgi:hypothetical protein